MIAVFRFSDTETFIAKLAQLGVPTRPAISEDGIPHSIEERAGRCMTPPLVDVRGNLVSAILLIDEEAAKIPDVTSPVFLCDWRSDETETVTVDTEDGPQEVERLLPWPEYEIAVYGEDGKQTGTRMQGCGRIA